MAERSAEYVGRGGGGRLAGGGGDVLRFIRFDLERRWLLISPTLFSPSTRADLCRVPPRPVRASPHLVLDSTPRLSNASSASIGDASLLTC